MCDQDLSKQFNKLYMCIYIILPVIRKMNHCISNDFIHGSINTTHCFLLLFNIPYIHLPHDVEEHSRHCIHEQINRAMLCLNINILDYLYYCLHNVTFPSRMKKKSVYSTLRCLARRPTIKAYMRPLSCRSPGYN